MTGNMENKTIQLESLTRKLKNNEKNVRKEDLEGRYGLAYERLKEEIRQLEKELQGSPVMIKFTRKEVIAMQKQRFELRLIRQYLTGDKYVRVFIQPVITIVQAEDGFYIWLAKIFGLALLVESAMIAIIFSI